MFVKIDNVNYFVLEEGKTALDVFNEIFVRMEKQYLSNEEKRKIIATIRSQISK